MKQLLLFFSILLMATFKTVAQVRPLHTVVVVLENHSYNQVVSNALLPYINGLMADSHTAVLTNSYGITHPSQPNYLHLYSGSAQGITDNYVPPVLPLTTPNLGAALIQHRFSFTGYSQGLPAMGSNDSSNGDYKRKHNPWVNWQGTGVNGIPPESNLPFSAFPSNFSNLPSVSFIVPDQANDMHNDSMAVSFPRCDNWLRTNLDSYIQWCKTHNSLFILTFDEDNSSSGNHILTFIIGQHIKGGQYNQRVTHHNLLRTIEDLYQVTHSGAGNDSSAIKKIWLNATACAGGSSIISSNITGANYQWQVNTGAGFVNISNNANYSGASTANLQLINAPTSWYGRQYRCNVNGSYSNTVTLRFVNYFTGTVSPAWENPLNWSCGSLPDANTDVMVTTNVSLNLNSITTVRSFTLSGAAKFTGLGNKKLTITH